MSKKYTIDEIKLIAIEKGGILNSNNYINNKTKLTWKCGREHIWDTTLSHVKNHNAWCPKY